MDKTGIYAKLNKARKMLKDRGIKPTGNNKFAGYGYYELQDFIPAIIDINEELGLTSLVSFEPDCAQLVIVDTEDFNKITFKSPMSEASLKGCHPVQNLGAVETYIRRYLYQTAYEITESDALNGTQGKDEPQKPSYRKPATPTPPPVEKEPVGPEGFDDDPIEGKKIIGIIPEKSFHYNEGYRHLIQMADGDMDYVKKTLKNLGVTSSAHITYEVYKKALGYLSLPKIDGLPA
jgi:hypothetical protein